MGRHRRSAAGRAESAAGSPAGTPAETGHAAYAHDAYDTHGHAAYDRTAYDRAAPSNVAYGRAATHGDHATSEAPSGPYVSAPYATSAPYPTSATSAPYPTSATSAPYAPYATSTPSSPYATSETVPGPSAAPRPAHQVPDIGPGPDEHDGASGHRRKRRGAPVRTGLLGVSAAVALGAVAVGTGLVPGGGYSFGGGHDAKVRAADAPSGEGQGEEASAPDRTTSAASRGATRSGSPSPTTSASPRTEKKSKADATPSPSRSVAAKAGGAGGASTSTGGGTTRTAAPPKSAAPSKTTPASQAPARPPVAAAPSGDESAAAAAVLSLVNQERAKVGCSAVRADGALASLATAFSDDMAARGFFDHTDPDGDTPWDRADQAGVGNLGGENIARGQADAAGVMESWMNSPGHRANILNCDYKTLGVGVHFGAGGPWWTQDFGF
ncbi:CAP domain-containing protein [Streptomyces sp. SID11385]|uniref:CAP domain-containing protein n=1 Tax=Streptomyces sp. SID11385 TaxID=2706031 RepID=UPI0013C5EDD6|nr:CAP domain-containing protein [Streptomyces sp. SID11385]NEA40253.1 CAP domain-containing protein [Streptomyces sp. SID11385]